MLRHPVPSLLLALACVSHAQDLATGVNLTASEGFGARHHGMALMRAGFAQGADAVVNAPASMNDVNDFTFTTAHAEQFGLARFDNAAVLIPLQSRSTLGIGVARYAVSDVEYYRETVANPGAPDGYFNTSDWMITGSFARRYGPADGTIDIGGSLHLLRRQLDQSGLGMRGDAMVQYTHNNSMRVGGFVRGLVPSSATWSEGHTEYELPEASLFFAVRKPFPYFYGTMEAGFETPGILQPGARSASSLEGERGVTDPLSVLKTSKVGAEFNFDFGLSLRAGFDELAPSAWSSSTRLGMGYNWRNLIALDYAFAMHPYLDESHRVALRFTPSFPKFEGRNFRGTHPASVNVRPERLRPTYPTPREPLEEDETLEPEETIETPAPTVPTPLPTPAVTPPPGAAAPGITPNTPPANLPPPQNPSQAIEPEKNVAPPEALVEELEEGEFLEE